MNFFRADFVKVTSVTKKTETQNRPPPSPQSFLIYEILQIIINFQAQHSVERFRVETNIEIHKQHVYKIQQNIWIGNSQSQKGYRIFKLIFVPSKQCRQHEAHETIKQIWLYKRFKCLFSPKINSCCFIHFFNFARATTQTFGKRNEEIWNVRNPNNKL